MSASTTHPAYIEPSKANQKPEEVPQLPKPSYGIVPMSHMQNSAAVLISQERHLNHRLDAANRSYTPASRFIEIKVPTGSSAQFLDFNREGGIVFDLEINAAGYGGSYYRLRNGAWHVFDRVELVSSGKRIEEINEHPLYMSWKHNIHKDDHSDTYAGESFMGIGSTVTRGTWAADRKRYKIPIPLQSLLNKGKILPTGLINSDLRVLLYINQWENMLETDGTFSNSAITISNVSIDCSSIEPKEALTTYYKNMLTKGGFMFDYIAVEHYVGELTVQGGDLQIPHRSDGLEAMVSIFRNSADISDPTVNDISEIHRQPNITTYRYRFGTSYVPQTPFDVNDEEQGIPYLTEVYAFLRRYAAEGMWRDNPTLTTAQLLDPGTATRFFALIDLNVHRETLEAINPSSNRHDRTDVFLRLNMSAPPGQAQRVDHFVFYSNIWKVDHMGRIVFNQAVEL